MSKRKEIWKFDSCYFRHYVQCQVQKEDIPPLTDVPQLIHQEETNPLTETDKLGKSCKKKHQIFR